jgi:hypothetical protein
LGEQHSARALQCLGLCCSAVYQEHSMDHKLQGQEVTKITHKGMSCSSAAKFGTNREKIKCAFREVSSIIGLRTSRCPFQESEIDGLVILFRILGFNFICASYRSSKQRSPKHMKSSTLCWCDLKTVRSPSQDLARSTQCGIHRLRELAFQRIFRVTGECTREERPMK